MATFTADMISFGAFTGVNFPCQRFSKSNFDKAKAIAGLPF